MPTVKAKKHFLQLMCGLVLLGLASCDLDIQPYDGKPPEEALDSAEGLRAATRGNYQIMVSSYAKRLNFSTAFSSDNITLSGVTGCPCFYMNNYGHFPNMGWMPGFWQQAYQVIHGANQVIESVGADASTEFAHLKGENFFLRALVHHQLARRFARPYVQGREQPGIPIIDSTGYVDAMPARNTVGEVYDFIVADLQKAAELMTIDKPNIRATKESAWALLSRVYLAMEENEQTIEYANRVLEADRYQLVDTETFRTYSESPPEGNPETIFAIKFTPADNNGQGALCSMYYTSETNVGWGEVYASRPYRALLDQYPEDARHAFIEPQYQRDANGDIVRDENGDPVLQERNGYEKYFSDKLCKQGGQAMLYSPVILRLAEMYLNRAEARAKLGQPEGAIADMNRIRERAGLSGEALYAVGDLGDHDTVLDAVLAERRLEFFLEGHRKYDLLRNGRPMVRTYPGVHLNPSNPGVNMEAGTQIIPADHDRVIYYIPEQEINVNPNLEQNP